MRDVKRCHAEEPMHQELMAEGFFRDLVLPDWAPERTIDKCQTSDRGVMVHQLEFHKRQRLWRRDTTIDEAVKKVERICRRLGDEV